MGIFNIDNKFFRALNKLVDMVILSFCWIISCIPVFTIGAASTALYDTSRRVIHHDEGYVWRGYWHAFKVNFKQATKAWLVQLIILIVLLQVMEEIRQEAESYGMTVEAYTAGSSC